MPFNHAYTPCGKVRPCFYCEHLDGVLTRTHAHFTTLCGMMVDLYKERRQSLCSAAIVIIPSPHITRVHVHGANDATYTLKCLDNVLWVLVTSSSMFSATALCSRPIFSLMLLIAEEVCAFACASAKVYVRVLVDGKERQRVDAKRVHVHSRRN